VLNDQVCLLCMDKEGTSVEVMVLVSCCNYMCSWPISWALATVWCSCLNNQVVCATYSEYIRVVGKARCCQGHGYVHQDETTWCQDAKANSYCFVSLSWFYHKFHVLKKNTFKKEIFIKNHHYYLQCEKVLERVFLHILNITKFG